MQKNTALIEPDLELNFPDEDRTFVFLKIKPCPLCKLRPEAVRFMQDGKMLWALRHSKYLPCKFQFPNPQPYIHGLIRTWNMICTLSQ